jgi:hypothetical protein
LNCAPGVTAARVAKPVGFLIDTEISVAAELLGG